MRSVRLKGDDRAEAAPGFHYSDGMGLQMGLDLKKDVAGVDGVAPVGPGDQKAEDVNGQPFVFEPPRDYTDKSGVAWLVQWLDDETVVVFSPLPQRTDLITCHLETKTCDVAALRAGRDRRSRLRQERLHPRLTPRRLNVREPRTGLAVRPVEAVVRISGHAGEKTHDPHVDARRPRHRDGRLHGRPTAHGVLTVASRTRTECR